jgi:PAS domain S-box-containing protein
MQLQTNPYAGLLVISALVSALLAVLAWRRRPAPGATAMTVLMLALALWATGYAFELASPDLAAMLFWTKVQYLAILFVPTLWLIFVLQYSGRGRWLTPVRLAALAIVPIVVYVLIWTTPEHGLLYHSALIDDSGAFAVLQLTYGPLFWAQAVYNYTVFFLATMLVLLTFLRSAGPQRAQSGVILVGALVPLLGNALYVAGSSPLPNLDLTPVLFIVTGLAGVWALLRYRLLDLLPVARDALIESMADGVAVVDLQGRVVDLNAAAQEMTGVATSAAVGAPAVAVLPGWPELARQLGANQSAQVQIMLVREGASIHLEVRVSPLYQDHAGLAGWLAVFHNVTARVRAEEAERQQRTLAEGLRSATAALSGTLSLDEVLDRILEQTEAIVPHKMGNIMLIEDQRIYIARARGFIEPHLHHYLHNLRLNVMDTANLLRMVETRQPLAIHDTKEFPGWVNVLDTEWIRSYAGAPMVNKGEVIGFLNLNSMEPGAFTEEHAQALQAFANQAAIAIENARLYASLQEANARLSQALLAREEAIQNVSHELRTPLALMMGYVEFIESGETGPVTGEQMEALRIVAQQGRRLQFIFNSLLTLQTFRQEEISPQRMDIVAWLHETVGAWRRLASDAGVAIQLEMPHHPLPVIAAPNYLELVIGNLLDNAIKFSPKASTITLSAWAGDGNALIAVADQGIGIPQEQLDRIFTRFYQIDSTPTRPVGGMGIGLALGRAIIAAHGGRIWAESAGPDQGSTFFVALPAAPPEKHAPGTLAPGGNV